MAGPVFELLPSAAGKGARPTVEVLPGISAVQARRHAWARRSATISATISLSDLLTPGN